MKKLTPLSSKSTYSVCPVCLQRIPAKLLFQDGNWYQEKHCEQHGNYKTVVWRGTSPSLTEWGNYHPPKESETELPNCPNGCGLCDKHLQSTCCVLVEVTDRCNLRCPICFAESGEVLPKGECGKDRSKPEKSVEKLFEDFKFLVAKGSKFIQLSGGEPTVRDDLPEIVSAAKLAGATSVQLNSNGLRLGEEPEFTKRLAEAGLDFVFLQFDGLDDEIYSALRGRPLLEEKLKAIKVCGEYGIGVTLVPTIIPNVNDHEIGAIIRFGTENSPSIRGVHFQPISYFGRYPEPPKDENRITLPEIVAAIEIQTEGLIRQTDLAPSSCDHPRCGFHGDFVIMQNKIISLTSGDSTATSSDCCCKSAAEVSPNHKSQEEALRNRNFVARRWKRNLSLESEAAKIAEAAGVNAHKEVTTDGIMDFDTFLARVATNGFTITGMAFQDAYNLDIDRLRRCSLHVYDEGRIIPFCAKYLTSI